MTVDDFLEKCADDNGEIAGWNYTTYEQDGEIYVDFQQYSPAGEDFHVPAWGETPEKVVDDLKRYYEDFDSAEHACMWYGQNRGEPKSLRDLLDDADAIDDMIRDLVVFLDDMLLEVKE